VTATVEATRERVVLILFHKNAVGRTLPYIEGVASRGVEVAVVVADGLGWNNPPALPDYVEVHTLGPAERRQFGIRAYFGLVERLPGGVLRRLETHLPGVLGRAFGRAARVHRKAAGKLRKRLFWPTYRKLRGHSLRRIALRRLGPLHLESATRVVCADDSAVPLAWSIARRHAHLDVTRSLHFGPYQDLPVTAPRDPWRFDSPEAAARAPYRPL
jgi:hypothetical protein